MATVLTSTKEMNREDWLAARRQGIGSSDVAAIMGLSPWANPIDVYLSKIEPTETEETEPMHFGTILEPIVAREFERRTGYPVKRRNAILQHRARPYMVANLDRLTKDESGQWVPLELKTASAWKASDWDDGRCPLYYAIQVHHQMAITDSPHGWLAVLIGGNTFRYLRIERNEALIAEIEQACEAFWLCVQTGTPPVIDGSEAVEKTLKLLYPASNGNTITLPEETVLWIRQRAMAKALIKDAEAQLAEAENHLKALLGEAEAGILPGYTVTWKSASRSGFDQKRFAAEHPDLAKQYATQTTYRTLRVKEAN